jgi:hypothetical protein
LHTLLDLRGPIPSFIAITDGRCHDVNALDVLNVLHVFSFFMAVLVPLDFLGNPEDTKRRLPEPPAAVSLT